MVASILLHEPIQNRVSVLAGVFVALSMVPKASAQTSRSRSIRATEIDGVPDSDMAFRIAVRASAMVAL